MNDDENVPKDPPAEAADAGQPPAEDEATSKTRRALLMAGWAVPVLLALNSIPGATQTFTFPTLFIRGDQ